MKRKIIFISGQQGSGKTTLAKALLESLSNARVFRFSSPLYALKDVAEAFGMVQSTSGKNGPFLQRLGDLLRDTFGNTALIDCAEREVAEYFSLLEGDTAPVAIIEDGRLPLEFEKILHFALFNRIGFMSVRLECAESVREKRAGVHWRPNTTHITESSSLGSSEWLSRFDFVFNTEVTSTEQMAVRILGQLYKYSHLSDATDRFSAVTDMFNKALRLAEYETSHYANFKWAYDHNGKKLLQVTDVAEVTILSKAEVEKAQAEIPGIIARAEKELE